MPEKVLELTPLAPLHFGDGRPFALSEGDETHARSLVLPLPHTLANTVRTQVALASGVDFRSAAALRQLHGVPVYGPLLFQNDKPLFPSPLDALFSPERGAPRLQPLRPWKAGKGRTDLPEGLLPLRPQQAVKAGSAPAFWQREDIRHWLNDGRAPGRPSSGREPPEEVRTHVRIDTERGAAAEGMLYSVAYRSYEILDKKDKAYTFRFYTLRARARIEDGIEPQPLGFLGGERRPVHLRALEGLSNNWWDAPEEIRDLFASADAFLKADKLVRLVLATPALFEDGWRPGWLEKSGSGAKHLPRGLSKVKLRLVAAAVGRRQPVSGWSLRENRPKPVRWAVPAGSVYFFEVEDGDPAAVLESWLRPVSDLEQDRKDGFGLALWGVGSYAD